MRKRCAEALIELGFDGYGFGGWPLDGEGNLNSRALKYTAELIPDDKYKYAMGVGNPNAVVKCFNMGYRMFDCVLPSRDARTGRLYILNPNVDYLPIDEIESKYNYLHIVDSQYKKDFRPVDSNCDCKTCRNYSRAYLYHLFDIGDSLAERLSTIHNLRTYTRLIEILRKVRDGSTKNR
jgi:queuine tRNA-ribosyltransferase